VPWLSPGPIGEIGLGYTASNQMKGVILFTTHARRLALAVLAGVLFALTWPALANAETSDDTVVLNGVTTSSTTLSPGGHMAPMDWWT
jgi:hypothetical protein